MLLPTLTSMGLPLVPGLVQAHLHLSPICTMRPLYEFLTLANPVSHSGMPPKTKVCSSEIMSTPRFLRCTRLKTSLMIALACALLVPEATLLCSCNVLEYVHYSAFNAFVDTTHAYQSQVASGGEGFSSTLQDPVYHYHSVYDSERWMELYGDPGFLRHVCYSPLSSLV